MTTMDAAPRRIAFDPLDRTLQEDPYPTYRQFRDQPSVLVRGGPAQWVVSRHAAVATLLRDPRLRNNYPEALQQMKVGAGETDVFLRRTVLHSEGDDHTLLRQLLGRLLPARTSVALRERVEQAVDEALAPALDRGRLEVVSDLALPVPLAVSSELFGIPPSDRPQVQEWGLELVKAFTVRLPEEERAQVNEAVRQLRAYFADPGGPPVAAEMIAEAAKSGDDRVSREVLVDNIVFLFVSGFTSTVHLIASGFAALLQHPDQLARVRADGSLVRTAVEESLRYDAPLQYISRMAVEAVPVEDMTIRPGRLVHLLIGAANRDERVFAEPERFDAGRDPNRHLSFGGGVHLCLGANLGRLEAAVLLERLLQRTRTLELSGAPVRRPMQVFRTYERVPAAMTPR
jgi:cytochrome P450